MKGLSALIYLESNLSLEEKIACIKLLINEGFLAYDYNAEKYVDASLLLTEEYMEYDRCSMRYKNEDFVFSSSINKDYITFLIDGVGKEAEIILTISDGFARILSNFKYAYIDKEGDSPNDLDKTVEALQFNNFFKYNYYGKPFIEKYGRKFFEDFPAEKVKFITENVVRVDLENDIFGKISTDTQNQVKDYLNDFGMEKVRFYDYKNHGYA